ncbi:MAG: type IV pilin N-terminal domain-containing protein [Archaeoglobaceae archaeon]
MNNKAVSQLIGTILMVAITTILAVFVASMSFGLVEKPKEVKTPAVLAERVNQTAVKFTLTNRGNAKDVKSCRLLLQSGEEIGNFELEIGVSVILEAPPDYYNLVCKVDNDEQIIWSGRI